MKKLVLFITFLELLFVTARNFNEEMAPHSSFSHKQRPKSTNFISLHHLGQNEKYKRILHIMSFIDPNCLRIFHNQWRSNRRPLGILRPLRMPSFRNDGINQLDQISYYNKMRQNQFKPQNRIYFGKGGTIYVPPYVKFSEKRNKTSLPEPLENSANEKPDNIYEMDGEIPVNKPFHLEGEILKIKDHLLENSTALIETDKNHKTIGHRKDQPSRVLNRLKNITSATPTHSESPSRYFWAQVRPTKIEPYEVEEIIEEELSIDLNGGKSSAFQHLPLGGPALFGKDIKGTTNSEDNQKAHIFNDVIGSSIKKVLKTLMSPVTKVIPGQEENREFSSKEQYQNYPNYSGDFTSTSPRYKPPPDLPLLRIYESTKKTPNRQEQSKHLKMDSTQGNERIFNWTQKSTESATAPELNYDSRISLNPNLRTENHRNVYTDNITTEISFTSVGFHSGKNKLGLTENQKHNQTTATEADTFSISSDPKLSDQISFSGGAKNSLKDFIEQYALFSPSELPDSPSAVPTTPTEAYTDEQNQPESTIQVFTEKSSGIPLKDAKGEESSSAITINEAELSTPNFQEFTDHPMSFDLLTMKSDAKKNSRKMNFGHELKETTSNQIIEFGSIGPRRSDILITENIDDYVDVDNNLSTLNYLDKLKQSNSFLLLNPSLDLTPESVIPLIPVILTDLREGKISSEDISILSKALSKYWSAITALSNITNLDMLPLLKMKNEEDLKKVLEIFFPEKTEATTAKTTETNTSEGNEYDYIDEYKDFYQYVLGSEQEEKEKKRKKLRPRRDDKYELKKGEAVREYFESTKQNPTDNYLYDDLVQNEILEVFDLRSKMDDMDIDLHNVTSRTVICSSINKGCWNLFQKNLLEGKTSKKLLLKTLNKEAS